jgi:probable phosphoglycerate mutase
VEITFVRHAQPAWDVDGMAQRDPGLTPLGREQAELLGERLAARRGEIGEVLVSPAQRCRETAAPLANALGLEPEVIDDLTEIKMPDLTGAPSEAVAEVFRTMYSRQPAEWWDGMPGGESFRAFHERVTSAVVGLLAARSVAPHRGEAAEQLWDVDDDRRIVVVAHAGTNAVALGFLLGLEPTPWEWERFVLGHASLAGVKTFRIGSAHIFSMRSFNDVEHLPREKRTRY